MLIASPKNVRAAAEHLAAHDLTLKPIIDRNGLCTIRPHRDYYRALAESIIGQQLSVKAARGIKQRLRELFGGSFPAPDAILMKGSEALRTAGLSGAKAQYVRDLAQHIVDGKVRFDRIEGQTNEEIIAELTDVKGIGEWTAHMFLMFCMGRLDVLPVGDLGIRNGVRALYGFKDVPTPEQIKEIARKNHWHPYESVAAWYVWASLDNAPN